MLDVKRLAVDQLNIYTTPMQMERGAGEREKGMKRTTKREFGDTQGMRRRLVR